jgi:hypothetical protein
MPRELTPSSLSSRSFFPDPLFELCLTENPRL